MNRKIELLSPAGDLEKLKTAIEYGADAVYMGGELFSLRAGADNFSVDELKEGVAYAHRKGRKCHLAVNIFAHNEDIPKLDKYIDTVKMIGFDAFIVSDPAIIEMIKDKIPDAEIHLSTQANMTNRMTANFWYNQGVKRIVLARELTLEEIKQIRDGIPADLELESFVHGAMCISYSGRCLLSNFMTERDANRGLCAHPCRWKYSLVEEKRPGEYFPVEEDDRGTYIMNSRDLCMIEHIPELVKAGISSVKIEGRMKSIFYVATVTAAYRKAIDQYYRDPENYKFDRTCMDELKKVSHREFTTGFYFNKPTGQDQNYRTGAYTRDYLFTGKVLDYDETTRMATVEQRNKMEIGETIEVFGPYTDFFRQKLTYMTDEEGDPIDSAPHPQQILKIKMKHPAYKNFIIRKEKSQKNGFKS